MKASISRSALSAVALSAALLGGCAATPAHESTGQYIDDTTITSKVRTELFGSEGIWSTDMSVKTVEGVVQLSGLAKSEEDRQRAGEIARSVGGVKQVDNQIRVQ
jgi:hyperosmotically inducible periplasmic protein